MEEAVRLRDKRMFRFIALSVITHVLVFLAVHLFGRLFPPQAILVQSKPIEIEVLEGLDQMHALDQRHQVVQTEKVAPSKETKDDAYLGEQTQKVDRQTRARDVDTFKASVEARSAQTSAEKAQQDQLETGEDGPKIGLRVDFQPMGHLSPQQQAQLGATGSTNDHLNKVADGSQTLLNTREYAYYSFYQRVRRQLEQFWEPTLRDRLVYMLRRGRRIASEREHATKVLVVLDNSGAITRVKIEGTSGIMDLDQVAVEAFNKAGPFPNPPQGLVGADGTVQVEWEFVLKT